MPPQTKIDKCTERCDLVDLLNEYRRERVEAPARTRESQESQVPTDAPDVAAPAQMSCKNIKSAVAEHDTTGGGMGENSRINLSEVVSILGEDGGSLLARVFAPCLTLQQLFCFGLVNKKCNSIFRGNVWELLLGCRDVKDQDSLISRLVNGDKTDFLKKLVELKIIQVEGMCIILVCVRAHITSGVFECVRAPGCMFVCVSVCDIKKVLQVYLPTQYTITHTLIFSSLHTYSYAYLYM